MEYLEAVDTGNTCSYSDSATKWQEPQRNVREGDLVLVLERQLARNQWPVGRVLAVHEGADGLVRLGDSSIIYHPPPPPNRSGNA